MIASSRFQTRFAFSIVAILIVGARSAPAQATAQDEATVGVLARLLALSDARQFDAATLRSALQSDQAEVRRQALLAAGRIGDAEALDLLLPELRDSVGAVAATAAFALGLLRDSRAVPDLLAIVRGTQPADQGPREMEAVTALAKIGGDEGAQALRLVLAGGPVGGTIPPTVSVALLEAWRLGARAPVQQLIGFADHADETIRGRAIYSLARLRTAQAAATLLRALSDRSTDVRAAAARGLTAAIVDSARLQRSAVTTRLRPLLTDADAAVRTNALRALASFRGDSTLVAAVTPLLTDNAVGVVVQAETTLGVLGGGRAVLEALRGQLGSPLFALRRQAVIGLAEADTAAGTAAATALVNDADWHWRFVAAEAFAACRNRPRLEQLVDDPDGRVVAQAFQGLARLASDSDSLVVRKARALLDHADLAVRSVAADALGKRADIQDVDRLAAAYRRAAGDPVPDARLAAVGALADIAAASAANRLQVLSRFISVTPRPDDYLVRRLAAARLPDAAEAWSTGGGGAERVVATGKTDADYRAIVRRLLLPVINGQPNPQVTIETERGGPLTIELLPLQAPLTVAAFLGLVDRHFFDGSRWHRVVPNFVIQDGDPRGDGWGGPGFVQRDEVNQTRYQAGTVGMALSGPDTGGSQFFITHSPQPHLDGTYTVFGRVASDMRILDQVAQGDRIRSIHR